MASFALVKIQNASDWSSEQPTIVISKDDTGWDEAYQNWLKGKNPTNSNEWKKGVYACFYPQK